MLIGFVESNNLVLNNLVPNDLSSLTGEARGLRADIERLEEERQMYEVWNNSVSPGLGTESSKMDEDEEEGSEFSLSKILRMSMD